MSTKQMYDQNGDKVSPLMEADSLKVELVNDTTLHILKINLYNKNRTLVSSYSIPLSGIVTNDMLAKDAVTNLHAYTDTETARAKGAEYTLTTNLSREINRAKAAEKTNADAIATETARAKAAESTLTTRMSTAEGNITTLTNNKADKASTLSGYGITDAYTKSEAYERFQTKGSYATLDSSGKVPASQLPSYVDDIIEGYYSNGKFYSDSAKTKEISGEDGKIYTDLTSNKTYRWGGTTWVEISASLAIGTTAGTAYDGASGAENAAKISALTTSLNTTNSHLSDTNFQLRTLEQDMYHMIGDETDRATAAESTLTTNLNSEITRAKAAEKTNADAIADESGNRQSAIAEETARAKAAEEANAKAISDETTRAKAAEEANATAIADESNNRQSAIAEETARAKAAEEANAKAIAALQKNGGSGGSATGGAVDPSVVDAQYGLVYGYTINYSGGEFSGVSYRYGYKETFSFNSLEQIAEVVIENVRDYGEFVISAYAKMKTVTDKGYTTYDYEPIWFTRAEGVPVVSALNGNISENMLFQGENAIIIFFYASQTNILK